MANEREALDQQILLICEDIEQCLKRAELLPDYNDSSSIPPSNLQTVNHQTHIAPLVNFYIRQHATPICEDIEQCLKRAELLPDYNDSSSYYCRLVTLKEKVNSIIATGFPTILLRPTTTAFLPVISMPVCLIKSRSDDYYHADAEHPGECYALGGNIHGKRKHRQTGSAHSHI